MKSYAMPLLTNKISIPTNFIHIPRTGGRYVVELLLSNGYDFIFGPGQPYYFSNIIDGFEVIHFHASLMEKHYKSYSYAKPFTIVRDPVDRFISGFPLLLDYSIQNNMEKLLYTADITKVIKSAQNSLNNNWFRPQHEFILPKTKIWKYEKCFENKFIDWLKSDISLDIKIVNNIPIGKTCDQTKQTINFSDEVLKSIKEYYSEDYLIL
jgi:hypothetical protein